MEIDQTLIAALLTILGYSINDTVVVYDRIRERLRTHKTKNFIELMNKGMNDTLSRTVITSLTTFFSILVLFIFGGETLKGFSFALMLGIVLGTYSSIFIATSITIDLEQRRQQA
jgi:preprotein translocase SecF subunit